MSQTITSQALQRVSELSASSPQCWNSCCSTSRPPSEPTSWTGASVSGRTGNCGVVPVLLASPQPQQCRCSSCWPRQLLRLQLRSAGQLLWKPDRRRGGSGLPGRGSVPGVSWPLRWRRWCRGLSEKILLACWWPSSSLMRGSWVRLKIESLWLLNYLFKTR